MRKAPIIPSTTPRGTQMNGDNRVDVTYTTDSSRNHNVTLAQVRSALEAYVLNKLAIPTKNLTCKYDGNTLVFQETDDKLKPGENPSIIFANNESGRIATETISSLRNKLEQRALELAKENAVKNAVKIDPDTSNHTINIFSQAEFDEALKNYVRVNGIPINNLAVQPRSLDSVSKVLSFIQLKESSDPFVVVGLDKDIKDIKDIKPINDDLRKELKLIDDSRIENTTQALKILYEENPNLDTKEAIIEVDSNGKYVARELTKKEKEEMQKGILLDTLYGKNSFHAIISPETQQRIKTIVALKTLYKDYPSEDISKAIIEVGSDGSYVARKLTNKEKGMNEDDLKKSLNKTSFYVNNIRQETKDKINEEIKREAEEKAEKEAKERAENFSMNIQLINSFFNPSGEVTQETLRENTEDRIKELLTKVLTEDTETSEGEEDFNKTLKTYFIEKVKADLKKSKTSEEPSKVDKVLDILKTLSQNALLKSASINCSLLEGEITRIKNEYEDEAKKNAKLAVEKNHIKQQGIFAAQKIIADLLNPNSIIITEEKNNATSMLESAKKIIKSTGEIESPIHKTPENENLAKNNPPQNQNKSITESTESLIASTESLNKWTESMKKITLALNKDSITSFFNRLDDNASDNTAIKELLTNPSEYKDEYIDHFFSLFNTRIAEGKDVSKIKEFLNGLGEEFGKKIDKLIKELEINSENTEAANELQVGLIKKKPSIVPFNLDKLYILLTRHPLISLLKSSENPEALIIHDATKQEELFKNILHSIQDTLFSSINEKNVFNFLTYAHSKLHTKKTKEQFKTDISSNYEVQSIAFDNNKLPLLLYKHKEDGSIFLATANKQFVFDSKDIFSDTKLLEEFNKKDAALSKKKFNISQAPTQLTLTEAYFAYHAKIKSIELELIKQPENEEKLNDKKSYKVSIEDLKKQVMKFLKQEISSGEDPILQNKFKELHKLHPEAPDLLKVLKNEESRSLIDNFFAGRFNDKDQEKLTNKIKKAILEDQDLLDYFDRKLVSKSKDIETLSASYLKLKEGNDENKALLFKEILEKKNQIKTAKQILSSVKARIEKDEFIDDAIDSIIDSISPLETQAKEASTTPIGSDEEEKNVHAIKVFLSQLKSAIEKEKGEVSEEEAVKNIKNAFFASFPSDNPDPSKDFKIKFFNSLVNLLKNPDFTNAYTFLDSNRDEPENKDLLGLFSETFNKKTMESLKTFEDSIKSEEDRSYDIKIYKAKRDSITHSENIEIKNTKKLVYDAIFGSLFELSKKRLNHTTLDSTASASASTAKPSASALMPQQKIPTTP